MTMTRKLFLIVLFLSTLNQSIAQELADVSSATIIVLRQHANAGEPAAEFELGKRFDDGRGVAADKGQAAVWYRKAAEQGVVDAQSYLAYDYQQGEGVPADDVKAAFWYRKAAEQGDVGSQNNLGSLYTVGRGVPQDYAQAVFWYRKAAEQGDASGQVNLASCYLNGHGVPMDRDRAHSYFSKAAAQGNAYAQTQLAQIQAAEKVERAAFKAANPPSDSQQAADNTPSQADVDAMRREQAAAAARTPSMLDAVAAGLQQASDDLAQQNAAQQPRTDAGWQAAQDLVNANETRRAAAVAAQQRKNSGSFTSAGVCPNGKLVDDAAQCDCRAHSANGVYSCPR